MILKLPIKYININVTPLNKGRIITPCIKHKTQHLQFILYTKNSFLFLNNKKNFKYLIINNKLKKYTYSFLLYFYPLTLYKLIYLKMISKKQRYKYYNFIKLISL